MTLDVATRLLCAAHDEWDISEESRALAADALAALKAAEAAARGAAFREREAANEAAMLRAQVDALTARVVDAEGEAALVAIGAALGREGATAGECVAAIGELRARLVAVLAEIEQTSGAGALG